MYAKVLLTALLSGLAAAAVVDPPSRTGCASDELALSKQLYQSEELITCRIAHRSPSYTLWDVKGRNKMRFKHLARRTAWQR